MTFKIQIMQQWLTLLPLLLLPPLLFLGLLWVLPLPPLHFTLSLQVHVKFNTKQVAFHTASETTPKSKSSSGDSPESSSSPSPGPCTKCTSPEDLTPKTKDLPPSDSDSAWRLVDSR